MAVRELRSVHSHHDETWLADLDPPPAALLLFLASRVILLPLRSVMGSGVAVAEEVSAADIGVGSWSWGGSGGPPPAARMEAAAAACAWAAAVLDLVLWTGEGGA